MRDKALMQARLGNAVLELLGWQRRAERLGDHVPRMHDEKPCRAYGKGARPAATGLCKGSVPGEVCLEPGLMC